MSALLSSDGYPKALAVWRSKSTDMEALSQWIQNKLKAHISTTVRGMQADQPLRVLAVASGIGDPDLEIIKLLLTFNRPIQYIVVEPNKYSSGIFKERVTKCPHFSDIEFKFLEQTLQSFLEGPDCAGPYHLIHNIMALSYFDDDIEMIIETCVNLLTTEGIFFTYFFGTNEGTNKIIINNTERRFGPSRQMYLMENMELALEQLCIRFSKDVYTSFFNVDFLIGGQSEEADMVLDALTEVTDARRKFPSLAQSVLDDIKREKIVMSGQSFLKDLCCVYTMRKT